MSGLSSAVVATEEENDAVAAQKKLNLISRLMRSYLLAFFKQLLFGQGNDFWRNYDNAMAVSRLLMNMMTMTQSRAEDEYCSFFLQINACSPAVLEALIIDNQLKIGVNWIIKLTWSYSSYVVYENDECEQTVKTIDDEVKVVDTFVHHIAELVSREVLDLLDQNLTCVYASVSVMYDHLLTPSNLDYFILLIRAFMENQTNPSFKQLGKMLRLFSECSLSKKSIHINVKSFIKAFIKLNITDDLCFIDYCDSFKEMEYHLRKIGLSVGEMEDIRSIINKDTPLDKDSGCIINKYEKETKRKRNKNNNSTSSSSSSSDGNESDVSYKNVSNASSQESNSSSSSSSSGSSSSSDGYNSNNSANNSKKKGKQKKRKGK